LQGLRGVARPGLEPGTPRFSDKRTPILNGQKFPAHKRDSAGLAHRPEVRKVHEMVGDVGHEMPLVAQWSGRALPWCPRPVRAPRIIGLAGTGRIAPACLGKPAVRFGVARAAPVRPQQARARPTLGHSHSDESGRGRALLSGIGVSRSERRFRHGAKAGAATGRKPDGRPERLLMIGSWLMPQMLASAGVGNPLRAAVRLAG
jgi:hypothetical protein